MRSLQSGPQMPERPFGVGRHRTGTDAHRCGHLVVMPLASVNQPDGGPLPIGQRQQGRNKTRLNVGHDEFDRIRQRSGLEAVLPLRSAPTHSVLVADGVIHARQPLAVRPRQPERLRRRLGRAINAQRTSERPTQPLTRIGSEALEVVLSRHTCVVKQ